MAIEIDNPLAAERERVLQQLIREFSERHELPALAQCIRIKGEPTLREKALREFAEQHVAGSLI